MTSKTKSAAAGRAVGAAFIGLAIMITAPLIERWEGTRTDPYRDLGGVWTVCTGETRVEMRRYTAAECQAMLDTTLEVDWAPAVLKAVPALKDRPYQFAAAISLTYNIGQAAFARSTVARRFKAGDWKGGCDAFLLWVQVNGKRVQGLVNRREAERKLCLTNL
ncbi:MULTISPECIES: lysozyme [unclassified Sphingobium]|uniref:lysozyme n=1 Tax=unclassified Sphingobium TaxID=2611147 RepID=UPI00222508C7|nr:MULTISPECIES: lysozyme [unclassified Sphingobium]MCW2395905.1 lysozyme [Sphingobium sp. B8D3B]MCW2419421.1 lysozyme [Sphingobium sp. B8D3C]